MAPHLVDVVHGRRRGVLGEIGSLLQLVAAGGDGVQGEDAVEPGAVPPETAVERRGFARAPGVDEHHVAPRADRNLGELGGVDRGASAGAAFEEEDGVRRPFGSRRRQDDDLQRDLAAGAGLPVLEDLVGAAVRLAGHFGQGAGGELSLPGRPRPRVGRRGMAGGRQEKGGENEG
jgi:hypothetical protein